MPTMTTDERSTYSDRSQEDAHNGHRSGRSNHELDLLAAALLGLAGGVAVTFLLRRGPSGRRPLVMGLSAASHGATRAGRAGRASAERAGRAAVRQARRGVKQGTEWLDELPIDDISEQVREYFDAAKEAIEDTIKDELHDLRKTVRRKRKHWGI